MSDRVVFGVITKVPQEGADGRLSGGNLATAFPVYVPSKKGAGFELFTHILDLQLQTEVWTVGEIVVLDGPGGREISGESRKPSKWTVTCEEFDRIDDAISRAREVWREEHKAALAEIARQNPK